MSRASPPRGRHRKTCAACGRQFYVIGKTKEPISRCDACMRNGIQPKKPIEEVVREVQTEQAIGVDDRVGIADANGRQVAARDYMIRLMRGGR